MTYESLQTRWGGINELRAGSPLSATPQASGTFTSSPQLCKGRPAAVGPPWDLGSLRHHPPRSIPVSPANSVTPPLYRIETNTRDPGGSHIDAPPHTHARTHRSITQTLRSRWATPATSLPCTSAALREAYSTLEFPEDTKTQPRKTPGCTKQLESPQKLRPPPPWPFPAHRCKMRTGISALLRSSPWVTAAQSSGPSAASTRRESAVSMRRADSARDLPRFLSAARQSRGTASPLPAGPRQPSPCLAAAGGDW